MADFGKGLYNPHEIASFSERRKYINSLTPAEFCALWDETCKKLQKYPEITSRIVIVNRGC